MMQRPNPFLSLGRRAPSISILSLFVLALVLCADALAASRNFVVESGARRPADRLALVIGNDYAGESGRLENPVNDADDMRQALAWLGFEVMGDNRLRLEDMTRLVRQFGDRLRPGMVGLFYFAGHGMQINGQNYLIPMQSGIEREDEVPFRALAVDQVLAKMSHNQTGLNLLMLDACRDNPFARAFRGNTNGLARMNAPAGTLIAYAAKPGTRSKDGSGRNGLYTGVLLKYLPIPGLPIEQMLKKVGAEVRQRSGDSQQTWMEGLLDSGDGGDFCFAGCGGASTPPYRPVTPLTGPTPVPTQVKPAPAPRPIPQREPVAPAVAPSAKPVMTPASACDLCPEMVRLPGGSFLMGSPADEPDRVSEHELQHRVTVSAFAIGRYEVTQAEWRAVMGDNPSKFAGCDRCPVENVSKDDAQQYIKKLNARTGRRYRLPTEEEWEYACRAGGTPRYYKYCGADTPEPVAWYGGGRRLGEMVTLPSGWRTFAEVEDRGGRTHPVGQKRPNAWGLYDMSGNVSEWSASCHEGYVPNTWVPDPPGNGSVRCSHGAFRGGSWAFDADMARAATRIWIPDVEVKMDNLGFRLAED